MSNKVQLLHPEGKKLPRIDKDKYELVKQGIHDILSANGEMKPMQLLNAVADKLSGMMEGSISWYAEGVKLDMQAHGELVHDYKRGLVWLPKK